MNAHIIDARGVYLRTETVDPMGAQPAGAIYGELPDAEDGFVRMWDGREWLQVAEGDVPPVPTPSIAVRQASAWERIKAERDRRKSLGVKVGQHWYHSDADSRIQQISLFVMGAAVSPFQWKTLTATPPPVFVTMTPAIAAGIFQNTAASDAAIFGVAEQHRIAMEASEDPESYDFSGGWPVSIEDAP